MVLQRIGPDAHHGWLWREDYPDDVFGRAFRLIVDHEYGGSLCSIVADEFAMLRKGERLLHELLPGLARSALGHVHLVGCFPDVGLWKGKVSSSQIRMGGTIFLNRQMLLNPWCVAEHLLHEALHQKLYDFRHGHSLLDPDFSGADSPRVCSLWNAGELNEANLWDTHRAFAAFHVYVQLGLLAAVGEQRAAELEGTYGCFSGLIESRKALHRARHLGEQLGELCAEKLGVAGKRLLDWLMSILDHLDPAPPPKGASLHLLLDRYEREANRIDGLLMQSEAARESLSRALMPAVQAEVDGARHVMSAIDGGGDLRRFDEAVSRCAGDERGLQLPTVRRMIARTLLEHSADGYRLGTFSRADEDPDALARAMVDAASDRLYLILSNVPAGVAAAKRRAKDLLFTKSCEDDVGRLLAVLAASVPVGGRILDIGTGVGVSLAWLASGLGERTDVELVSIEGDQRLSHAANTWRWPSHVRMLTADASEVLPDLGTFDLVFADAAPIKYGPVEPMLVTLRAGAKLVIDDLQTGPRTTRQQHAEKDALRHGLRSRRDLHVMEFPWASGLILATRFACDGPLPTTHA